ncbi:MAG: DUF6364 family protein [Candidatus Bathyarchaeia archaeon]
MKGKTKLTISIDGSILASAKRVARQKRVSLSGLIENFLRFYSGPWVYCYNCGHRFEMNGAETCAKCGWLQCPECHACRCGLSEEAAVAVFHMRRTAKDLLVE